MLYKVIDGCIEFRQQRDHELQLWESTLEGLRGSVPRDTRVSLEEQATRLVRKSGWTGGDPVNADSPLGKIFKGKRLWYNN
jgi:hypothetical protein